MTQKHRERPGYRNVAALGFVSFFTDVSTEMILGVLPTFIVFELGATKAILGVIEGLAELSNFSSRLFSGLASDKLGKRKILVFTGYLSSSIAKPLFALARTWVDALIVRTLDRIGKGIRTPPRDALISQSVREPEAGKAFGIHRTLDQLGAVLGPTLAFLVTQIYGYRLLFLLSFIPASAALLILGLLVVEVEGSRRERKLLEEAGKVFEGRFLLLIGSLIIFNLGAYNFSFILVRATELGIPEAAAPLVYMLINLVHAAVGFPSGILADKLGRERILALGIGLFASSSLMLMYSSGGWVYSLLTATVFGAYQGIYDTTSRAVVPKYVPEELRGTAYGVYYLVVGLSFLAGMSTVGFLWDTYGIQPAFTYSFAMSTVSLIPMIILSAETR